MLVSLKGVQMAVYLVESSADAKDAKKALTLAVKLVVSLVEMMAVLMVRKMAVLKDLK
jgi:hypothetical protein